MATVGLSAEGVEKYITSLTSNERFLVAYVNSPSSVTLSGDLAAFEELKARIEADDIFARKSKVSLGYHSHHMTLISEEYTNCLTSVLPEKARSWDSDLFSSPVTGGIVTSAEVLSPCHWARNLTSSVLFSQAFESMCFNSDGSTNVDIILEIGFHSMLAGPVQQVSKARGAKLPYASCLIYRNFLVSSGRDYPVSLASINFPPGQDANTTSFVTDLPTYPWNHTIAQVIGFSQD